jgi:hypothetical protein
MTAPLFVPNGDGYDIAPAGVLMMMGDTVCNNHHESSPKGRALATQLVKDILKAAHAGGYKQADILETLLLEKGESSKRIRNMCVQACEAAGNEAIGKIFNDMRLRANP